MKPKQTGSSSGPSRQIERIRKEVVESIDQQISETLQSLPPDYVDSVSESAQVAQLKAVLAARICDIEQEIMLRQFDNDRLTLTVVSRQNYAGYLAQLIRRLPDEGELLGAKIFSSTDQQFVIDIFEFVPQPQSRVARTLSAQELDLVPKIATLTDAAVEEVKRFLACYRPGNELLTSAEELARQFLALNERSHPNDLNVMWQTADAPAQMPADGVDDKLYAKITVSSGNATTREVFTRAAEFFAQFRIDIERAYCENIWLDEHDQVALLTFHVGIAQHAFDSVRETIGDECSELLDGDILRSQLLSFLRVDEEIVVPRPSLGTSLANHFGNLEQAELFCAFARLIQQVFQSKRSRERIMHRLLHHDQTTRLLLEHFVSRYAPTNDGTADTPSINLESMAETSDREIFRNFLTLVEGIDGCNLNLSNRRTLSMRLPGKILSHLEQDDQPFCVFYLYGSGFDGFHVRFRDVARGGMRIVKTRNQEHFLYESSRAFDEVYRLAFAQQLKNKDIAEGGAKALLVLKPRLQANRAGQDFIDGILDLLVEGPAVSPGDRNASENEYLYFGPDENVSNKLIDWFVNRAAERGYPFPNSIISSKPSTGINHKEFGVTSEGVIVFLHQALLECGVDRDEPFTVKLTGGPDGDVGGNAIRILVRDFGTNARIVGIADGTGTAVDPDGLDHTELLRLVDDELGIAQFNQSSLGPQGRVTDLSSEEDIAWRNSLHFNVQSDVFIPAGGRPSAINDRNWQKFLDESGQPSSKIVVEGANLFITDGAREQLSQHGVVIVKDSSANKCGVICSSLEIISAMLLNEQEILAIRDEFIAETIHLLRSLARVEAVCLFNERTRCPQTSLPQISVLISRQILRVADEIAANFGSWSVEEQRLGNEYILSFLPSSLIAKVGSDVVEKIPPVYRMQLIAAIVSSRIVYREGWRNLSEMRSADLARLVRREMAYEQDVQKMIRDVKSSSLTDKEKIISVLKHAGARTHRELSL